MDSDSSGVSMADIEPGVVVPPLGLPAAPPLPLLLPPPAEAPAEPAADAPATPACPLTARDAAPAAFDAPRLLTISAVCAAVGHVSIMT